MQCHWDGAEVTAGYLSHPGRAVRNANGIQQRRLVHPVTVGRLSLPGRALRSGNGIHKRRLVQPNRDEQINDMKLMLMTNAVSVLQ